MSLLDGQQVLAAQPFNDLVGARLVTFNTNEAVLEIDIADRHRQQYGLVHGGVLAYLADNALTFAAGATLGPSIITSGFSVSYLRGSRIGTLRARGSVVHHSRGLAVTKAEITCTDQETHALVAIAQGTVVKTST